jgi:hypothetical protein
MKQLVTKIILVLFVVTLASCTPSQTAIPTQKTSLQTPTMAEANASISTPTPEIFNPVSPSPTPSNSSLPLTCQVTDLNVSIDHDNGYCFAYPIGFSMGESPYLDVPAVMGPPVDQGPDEVSATFGVVVTPSVPGQKLSTQVDNFLKDFTTVDLNTFTRTDLTVGGEPAMMVDNVPVQLSWRVVFVQHGDKLYRLMYWPTDVPAAQSDLEQLYQTTLNSFAFLPTSTTLNPTEAPAEQPVIYEGVGVTYGPMSLVIPPGLASGAEGSQLPRVDGSDAAWYDLTPGHTLLSFNDYVLKDKSLKPQIFVYPAQGYAELNSTAAQSIEQLKSILDNSSSPINPEQLPLVPFFTSKPAYSAVFEVIPFQNGSGIRFLTQYGQSAAPANNQELFYQFQGLTNDGAFYIIVNLPITAPGLGDNSDPAQAQPIGGVAYPTLGDPNADWNGYFTAVTELLNNTPPKAFTPTLAQLDVLIESMQATP